MQLNIQRLIEFSFKLIDIQIKKYHELARIGIGPDAKVSAGLIRLEVVDLLGRLSDFLRKSNIEEQDCVEFSKVIRFYLDCEYLRGRAGWLLDPNRIHNTVYERVTEQLQELQEIAKSFNGCEPLQTASPEQQTHLAHSHAIAFRILDLVAKLKEDPDREDLDTTTIGHGLSIVRNHARANGRYHEAIIISEINNRHADSQHFLKEHSGFIDKNRLSLDKAAAQAYLTEDQKALQMLLSIFLEKHPTSALAQADFAWYSVAKLNKDAPQKQEKNQAPSLLKWGLFGLGLAASFGAVYAMVPRGPTAPSP